MSIKVGINGFGRIGRLVFRASLTNPDVQVVGINDPFIDLAYMQYMLRYDSVHGRFDGEIGERDGKLVVNGKEIMVYACMDPKDINWAECGAEYVVDFLPKVKIEIAISDDMVDAVIESITRVASTGKIGDGKIFVTNLEQVIRIRTGETGADAV